jgi:hypothetical protein
LADFEALTDSEARSFDRFERMRDWGVRFRLLRLGALARIRVAQAVARGLRPRTRTKARTLAELSRRQADGYDHLATLEGAVRFCDAHAARTAVLARVTVVT